VEDGILTARDVSGMSLSNTELVVLSACQTGLGDVNGSEGVSGLQRAFKMAGVHYILMSLWPVPDRETVEFMDDFYGFWMSGKSIREAFNLTQVLMHHKYPDDPSKWAAFVLME
jgi:CHAT domain-containing protein